MTLIRNACLRERIRPVGCPTQGQKAEECHVIVNPKYTFTCTYVSEGLRHDTFANLLVNTPSYGRLVLDVGEDMPPKNFLLYSNVTGGDYTEGQNSDWTQDTPESSRVTGSSTTYPSADLLHRSIARVDQSIDMEMLSADREKNSIQAVSSIPTNDFV